MCDMKLRFVPNVPNILTLIRLLAIPVLAYLIKAGDAYNLVAFIVFLAIWLTDMLDGYVARRFNQMTEFGKLFDPLVDKLYQVTTALMMYLVGKLPLWVLLFVFVRELLMIIGSFILFKKTDFVVFSKWYGKVATLLFVAAFAALFFLNRSQAWLSGYIFILPIAWSFYAYLRYGLQYVAITREKKRQTSPKG